MDLNVRSRIVFPKIDELVNKKVCIVGVGGVGGAAAEALARSNIGHLRIIDFDVFDYSNLNRQLFSNKNVIGQIKVQVAKQRIEMISNCEVDALAIKLDSSNLSLLDGFDYVVDAIDDFGAKVALIEYCLKNNIPVISALGMGNRLGMDQIEITTLEKTINDPLAKKLRHTLKKKSIDTSLNVVFNRQAPIKNNPVGSMVFSPMTAGLRIALFVIEKLIK